MAQHPHHPALGVGLDLFKADLAVQFGLVEAFDTGFTDRLRAPVLSGVQLFGFFLVDAANVSHRVGEMIALGIVAYKLGFYIDSRQAELIDRQQRDLLFAQLIQQGRGVKRVAGLLH